MYISLNMSETSLNNEGSFVKLPRFLTYLTPH